MAYKIGSIPGSKSYIEERADFWEITALQYSGSFVSQLYIGKALAKELDELSHEGIDSEDDQLNDKLDDVFKELERRISATNSKYPFEFKRYSIKLDEAESITKDVYLFLLLSTRFNMKENKIHGGIDATHLFEDLCAWVAKKYFGVNADSYVFGTSNPGSFEDKVNEMISRLKEGDAFRNRNNNTPTKNDDAVDVVVWKDFAENRAGKLIGFGQCKTGTSWRKYIADLKPEKFCNSWFHDRPVFYPISLFFISDTMNWEFNYFTTQYDYVFFNRFRIIEHVDETIPESIITRIRQWLSGGAVDFVNSKSLVSQ